MVSRRDSGRMIYEKAEDFLNSCAVKNFLVSFSSTNISFFFFLISKIHSSNSTLNLLTDE